MSLKNQENGKVKSKFKIRLKNTKFLIYFRTLIVVGMCIISFGAISIFAGSKERSLAGFFFDTVGLHQLSLGVEIFRKNPKIITTFTNYNRGMCASNWDSINLDREKLFAGSFSSQTKISSLNPEFIEDYIIFNSNLSANLRDVEAFANFQIDLKTDLSDLQVQSQNQDISSLGEVEITADMKAFINPDIATYKVKDLNLKSGEFVQNTSLDNWYGKNFTFSQMQKEGIGEIAEGVEDILAINPKEFTPKELAESSLEASCNNIDKIEIGDIQENTFGKGKNKFNVRARVVGITQKNITAKTSVKESAVSRAKLIKSDKFKNYLLSRYNLFRKFNVAINKIKNLENPENPTKITTQDKYIEGVNFLINLFDSSENLLNTNEDLYDTDDYIQVEPQGAVKYYLDNTELKIVATQSVVKVVFSDNILETAEFLNIIDEPFKTIIKDGLIVEHSLYNFETNEQLKDIPTPTNFKPISDFESDLTDTDIFKKTEKLKNSAD